MGKGYRQWMEDLRSDPEYWAEAAVDDFTREIVQRMHQQGVSRAELARRLSTSQAYITKLLGGGANFTVLTMARVALALEGVVHIQVTDKNVVPLQWAEVWRTDADVEAVAVPRATPSTVRTISTSARSAAGDQLQEVAANG